MTFDPDAFIPAKAAAAGIRYVLAQAPCRGQPFLHIWDAINDERPSAP
jgi:hypothetical protein